MQYKDQQEAGLLGEAFHQGKCYFSKEEYEKISLANTMPL
jgi:hypothetical protein